MIELKRIIGKEKVTKAQDNLKSALAAVLDRPVVSNNDIEAAIEIVEVKTKGRGQSYSKYTTHLLFNVKERIDIVLKEAVSVLFEVPHLIHTYQFLTFLQRLL